MFNPSYLERLIETVTLLVRHPEYPTKRWALEQSRREVTELIRTGRLSVPEAEMLYEILDTYPLTRTGEPGASGSEAGPEPRQGARECCPAWVG
jgi:hypothetical protein